MVIPFVVWCVVYAFYYYAQGTNSLRATLLNISHIPLNYGTEVRHLWFVYMLMAKAVRLKVEQNQLVAGIR